MPYSTLRIAKVLKEHLQQRGSAVALADAIHAAGGTSGRRPVVDRRKLKAIVDTLDEPGKDVTLSLRELCAIDAYLERFGEGLAYKPLFDKPDILTAMAESQRVLFYLGAKPEAETFRINLSHWDVQAMAEVQRALYALSDRLRIETHDVHLSDNLKDVKAVQRKLALTKARKGPSLVCLASSRSNPTAETMLTAMFGLKAFESAGTEADARRVPFHFIWKEGLPGVFPSRFHLDGEGLKALYPISARSVPGGASALVLGGGDTLVDELTRKGSGATYGVIAVQRRPGGQVWVVLAGVTGPATLACAQVLPKLQAKLEAHQAGPSGLPPVVWAAVRADARPDGQRTSTAPLDVRRARIVGEPQVWQA